MRRSGPVICMKATDATYISSSSSETSRAAFPLRAGLVVFFGGALALDFLGVGDRVASFALSPSESPARARSSASASSSLSDIVDGSLWYKRETRLRWYLVQAWGWRGRSDVGLGESFQRCERARGL